MNQDSTKDKRINIRLDDDTFYALKKVVEKELKTDISSYCRSLLWVSTLHDSAVFRIKNAVERFGKETNTDNMEYMLKIKDEILFIGKFLERVKQDREKYDEFISMIEKWHETIRNEARKYYKKHNDLIDRWEKEGREYWDEEYDTNPTVSKSGLSGKIDV